ncbi:MAG: AAA family ATPase [Candidatus Omnitrophica bacterium]|nr:AAA family ATPase [Candidatus Omnitrophota bacterium]
MDELTLRDYMKVLFRQKWVIILCIIIVTLTVVVGLRFKTPSYAASVKLLISAQKQSESPYYHDVIDYQNNQLVLTQSEVVISRPVLDRALKAILPYKSINDFVGYERRFASPLKQEWIDYQIKKFNEKLDTLGLTPSQRQSYLYEMALDDLIKNVKVDPVRDTNVFTITVTDFDPAGAAVIANIISRSYIIFDLEQQLAEMQQKYGEKNLAVSQLQDSIKAMTQNLTGQPLDNVEAIGPASVKIIEQAYPPIEPKGPKKIIILILGIVMSIFLSLMLAFIFDYMDQTFRSPEDIERFLGVPYLGSVPKRNKLFAFQNVAEQIYLLMKDKAIKTLIFTSTHRGEGVSTVSHNVAKNIASTLGHRVLIIDANPRQNLQRNKEVSAPGLFEILEEKADFGQCIQKIEEKLHILPAGQAKLNPVLSLGSHLMAEILKQAKEKYEIVLIDTDSLNNSKDALGLSNAVEAVVLIVAEGRTRRHSVKIALQGLNAMKVNLLGAILNKRTFPIPKFVYERV